MADAYGTLCHGLTAGVKKDDREEVQVHLMVRPAVEEGDKHGGAVVVPSTCLAVWGSTLARICIIRPINSRCNSKLHRLRFSSLPLQ